MGRRRQVSDEQISLAAREVFLERGPKAPVAMVAKKLGVSTATLFQRTGSKQQLMLMALQPETTAIRELDRGVQPDVPVRDQLVRILVEINEYLGTIISGSITLRAALACPSHCASAAKLLDVDDARTTADVLIGTLEARHIHAYMQQEQLSSKQHREFIRAMLGVVFPERG